MDFGFLSQKPCQVLFYLISLNSYKMVNTTLKREVNINFAIRCHIGIIYEVY